MTNDALQFVFRVRRVGQLRRNRIEVKSIQDACSSLNAFTEQSSSFLRLIVSMKHSNLERRLFLMKFHEKP